MTVKGFRGNHASRIENGSVGISFPFDDLRGDVIVTTTTGDQIDVFPVDAFERYGATAKRRLIERASYFAFPAAPAASPPLQPDATTSCRIAARSPVSLVTTQLQSACSPVGNS